MSQIDFDSVMVELSNRIGVKMTIIDKNEMKGYYTPCYNEVVIFMGLHKPESKYLLFHELAHATGQSSRLNRPRIVRAETSMVTDLSEMIREELIADNVARKLCKRFGFEDPRSSQFHKDMIHYWTCQAQIYGVAINDLDLDIQRAYYWIVSRLEGMNFFPVKKNLFERIIERIAG